MATLKQIQANRRNSRLSTGPTSSTGKAVSRMNGLKTGIDAQLQIIRGEDPAAFAQLTSLYYQRYQPIGPEECDLLDSVISNAWLLRRLRKTEAQIWNHSIDFDQADGRDKFLQLRAFSSHDRSIDRCHSRLSSVERAFRMGLEAFYRLRKLSEDLPPIDPSGAPPEQDPAENTGPNPISTLPQPDQPLTPALPALELAAPPELDGRSEQSRDVPDSAPRTDCAIKKRDPRHGG